MRGEKKDKHPDVGSSTEEVGCVLVSSGDWEGLYINGRLVNQNHALNARDVLEALAEYGVTFSQISCDEKWLVKVGGLPPELTKVKRGK